IEFDHVEFRFFFLGEALAKDVRGFDDKARGESLAKLRKGQLPENAKNAFARAVIRSQEIDRRDVAEFFVNLSSLDIRGSYTHENCGNLAVRLLNEVDGRDFCISGLSFGVDSLRHCQLMNLRFEDCVFYSTSLEA